jgi:pre-mRNA-processing factor 6
MQIPPQSKTSIQPTNYIAGLGRGAIGFTTRSDIGPARFNSEPTPAAFLGMAPTNYTAGVGRGAIALNRDDESHDAEMGDYSDAKYDEWSGYSGPLFSMADYDEEDKEA